MKYESIIIFGVALFFGGIIGGDVMRYKGNEMFWILQLLCFPGAVLICIASLFEDGAAARDGRRTGMQ